MARNKYPEDENGALPSKGDHRTPKASESEPDPDSDSGDDGESRKSEGSRKRTKHKKSKTRTSNSKRRRSRESDSYSSSSYSEESDDSDSESEYSDALVIEIAETFKMEGRNKRPEFTAWLAEVKQVNLESLPNWEEKQLFKEYYNLDAYYQRKMEKEMKKGFAKLGESERTVFNDEEQRRLELQQEREKQKEQQVEALKHSMQSGMAQAMKEQAQLREEMAYQYKLGNFEAAAAIQRRLDPDVAM
ncbi:hypothetical protein DH2020_011648 [Rehmannia glutinosa]|uniref:Uncharacterized protein n=1 Tax=Rehmannia glutinosa TaxID=99300 RepID=A0ABR0XE88_REHGL